MTLSLLSPWIHQLSLTRTHPKIESDGVADIAIIGAGIAGVSTAYFALKHTKNTITLIEGNKVAHGATGHNAGQIVSYFEHPFAHLVEKYGLTLAARAQEAIHYTWDLIEEIYVEAHLTTPKHVFTGYAGCSSVEQIIFYLENIFYQRQAGLNIEEVLVLDDPTVTIHIPEKYARLYALVDKKYLEDILETNDTRYIGALASKKGCLNSALFCEELIEFLLTTYPERFRVYEHSRVEKITLSDRVAIRVNNSTFIANKVVLCTNGFEHFTIENPGGEDINTSFHQTVISKIGYMAAYVEGANKKSTAISYFSSPEIGEAENTEASEPYFYMTRRPFLHKELGPIKLVCMGGPEADLEHKNKYSSDMEYSEQANRLLDEFIRTTSNILDREEVPYLFHWHGLMGYTPSGLRIIGPEPKNPILLYNLGCNGVGILSSIYGGKRISMFLNNEKLEKSVFDPI